MSQLRIRLLKDFLYCSLTHNWVLLKLMPIVHVLLSLKNYFHYTEHTLLYPFNHEWVNQFSKSLLKSKIFPHFLLLSFINHLTQRKYQRSWKLEQLLHLNFFHTRISLVKGDLPSITNFEPEHSFFTYVWLGLSQKLKWPTWQCSIL